MLADSTVGESAESRTDWHRIAFGKLAEYTRTLAQVLRRPAVLPVPSLGPRLLLGEQGARELAGASQRVAPWRLNHSGHRFRQPDLDQALRHLLGRNTDQR